MNYVQKYFEQYGLFKPTQTQKTPNVFLYCNYYSFYSQKVLMALYEKNIEFEPIVIDITKGEQYSQEFLQINPRGEIPVLKVKNQIIPDSIRIMDYLEKYFEPDTIPLINVTPDAKVIKKINMYRELIEALPAGVITVGSFFHPHLSTGAKLPFVLPIRELLKSGDLNNSGNLRKLAKEYPDSKEILLYKAEIQDRKHNIYSDEQEYIKILNIIDQVLGQVEEELQNQLEGNWLCSDKFTIADINLAILLQRLWELGLEHRFWTNGRRPFIENYYSRIVQRESFKKTIPNISMHLKMLLTTQPPAYIGAAGIASVGFVLTFFYIVRKIIK